MISSVLQGWVATRTRWGGPTSIACLALALVVAATATASPPRTLSVQGRLELADGSPVTGAQMLTLRVYDASTGGNLLYSEEDPVVFDARGFFSTEFGDKTPNDPPAAYSTLDFDVPYWVAASLDSGASELSPRFSLRPVPYAKRALVATALSEATTSGGIPVNGARLTGLADPTAAQDAATRSYVDGRDGDLTSLSTTAQSNLVAAINEVGVGAHSRYLDSEAVAAMGTKGTSNPLHHDRYLDSEAVAAMGAKATGNPLHHDRYTDAEAVTALGAKATGNALNHDRYTDSEALAALGTKADGNALHHDRYTDAEAVAAMGTKAAANTLQHDRYTDAEVLALFPKLNLTATAPPSGSDDSTAGYSVGSLWVDGESRTTFELVAEPSAGNAVWKATSGSRRELRVAPVYASGVEDPTASGTHLKAVLAAITDASASNRYRIDLDPGIYDVGTQLTLKSYVTLRGSGMENTVLRGQPGAGSALVVGADEAPLVDLQVADTGTHTGRGYQIGSGTGVLRRVKVAMSSGQYALYAAASTAFQLDACEVVHPGAGGAAIYLFNGSSLTMRYSQVTSSGSGAALGVEGSSVGTLEIHSSQIRTTTSAASSSSLALSILGVGDVTLSAVTAVATGGNASAADISGAGSASRMTIEGSRFQASSTTGTAYGLLLGSGSGASGLAVTGNIVRAESSGGLGRAWGINVYGSGGVGGAISGNDVYASGSDEPHGLRLRDLDFSVVGNRVRASGPKAHAVYSQGTALHLNLVGNLLEATGDTTAQQVNGVLVTAAADLGGNSITVSGPSSGATAGVRASGSGDLTVTGGTIAVSGAGTTYGILSGVPSLVVQGAHLSVTNSAGDATGIDAGAHGLLARGTYLKVTSGSSAAAVGFQADPDDSPSSVVDDTRVAGCWIQVAGGSDGTLADTNDATGTDLRVFDSRVTLSGTTTGTGSDVTCTDSQGC